jgi:membrane-associated phospholipid phosphatase
MVRGFPLHVSAPVHLSPRAAAAQTARQHRRYLGAQSRYAPAMVVAFIAYAVLFTCWFVYYHTWPGPDVVGCSLLLFALVAARGLRFLRDWTPFILLLLCYEALTGLVNGLVKHVNETLPIRIDRWLFGNHVPTTWLQAHLWDGRHVHWYDQVAVFLYQLHFIVPLVIAFLFWMFSRGHYWRFVRAYVLMTFAALVTYLVLPVAPPWWAGQDGKIPPVNRILWQVHWGPTANPIVLVSRYFKPNPVAAMPSMHAAFPLLLFLVLWSLWPRWGLISVAYPLAMALSVVYLGEHYVADVLGGWFYALVAFWLCWHEPRRRGVQPAFPPVPALSSQGQPAPVRVRAVPQRRRPLSP